jgi:NTE family protein
VCALVLLLAAAAPRQPPDTASDTSGTRAPRIAVALSGGGAKGLAHIGVLRALEEQGITPAVVTGTSMGALVGGLYAIGYSPAELDSIVRRLDWRALFQDLPDGRFIGLERRVLGDRTLVDLQLGRRGLELPGGAIRGQRISELLDRLTWPAQTVRDFRALPRPFAAVATDVATGEAVVLDGGTLSDALRASMSIPSVFAPVRAGGRLLIDGGIARNLPAQEARALGATVVICSDVSAPLAPASEVRSLVDVLSQSLTFQISASVAAQRRFCDVYIRPDITGLGGADFGRAGDAIERGARATLAVRGQLRALRAEDAPQSGAATRHAPWRDSVRASRVVVEGAPGRLARIARRATRLRGEAWVSAAGLDSAVQRLYATDLYEEVRYRLDAEGGDTVVVIAVEPRERGRLGVGLRYDGVGQSSILFSAQLRGRFGAGSKSQLDARLGEQLQLGAYHTPYPAPGSRLVTAVGATYTRSRRHLHAASRDLAEARVQVSRATVLLGAATPERRGIAGVELIAEHAAVAALSTTDSSERRTRALGALVLRRSTVDRPAFPTRGYTLEARSVSAVGRHWFAQHIVQTFVARAVSRDVTLSSRAVVGTSMRRLDVPLHRRFVLGGTYVAPIFPETEAPFVGARAQALIGTSAVRLGSAVQWEARRGLFVTARGDVGYAGDALTVDRNAYRSGVGVSLGAPTLIGPLEVTVSSLAGRWRPHVEIVAGHSF